MQSFNSIWYVLFLPLIGFLIQAFFGGAAVKKMGPAAGKKLMGTLAVLPIAVAFVIGAYLTFQLAALPVDQRSIHLTLFPWISLASVNIPFEFLVDPLSMTMVLIITGIGALIHLYATGYMSEEQDYPRFFTYLNLFIAMMLTLVLGNNLVIMFIGWEGVGLCSYLLIGFWYKDLANARAANKAFIVNRIGDWGLSLGMFLLFVMVAANAVHLHLGDAQNGNRIFSYDVLFGNGHHISNVVASLYNYPAIATAIALLLFVGAAGKSAQFPLYLWLPDAMAGPTPVSALIHAATMVTAGVFMVNRMHIVFELSPVASAVMAAIGAFTALFAAVIAFGQTDIKKVLAYSTVSQLGFMFVACGAGAYWAGMFHVVTHAFFKALLFLGSGAVIHAMAHNQDMRNYGNLQKYLKITTWTMVIGWLAISGVGIPISGTEGIGLAGFHSKEAIIGSALAGDFSQINGVMVAQLSGWVALFVALLTAMYMTRLSWLTFFGTEERWRAIPAGAHTDHDHTHHTDSAHDDHAEHASHAPHHGDDVFGFYYTDEEILSEQHAMVAHEEHHHELDANHTPHEVPPSMYVPLVVLAFLSLVGGFILSRPAPGSELPRFETWLYPRPLPIVGEPLAHPENIPLLWLSLAAAFGGLALGFLVYRKGLPANEGLDDRKWKPWRLAARNQFGYDQAMMTASVEGGADVGVALWKGFDIKVIDLTVNGVAALMAFLGTWIRKVQTGYARSYALMMLAGVVAIIGYLAYAIAKVGGGQ